MSGEKKILLIDDDDDVRDMLQEALTRIPNAKIKTARDGKEGFETFKSLKPDVLISDVRMPKMSGLEMLQKLIAEGHLKSLHNVIIMTGFDSEMARAKAETTKIRFLAKPFAEEKLISLVNGILTPPKKELKKA